MIKYKTLNIDKITTLFVNSLTPEYKFMYKNNFDNIKKNNRINVK